MHSKKLLILGAMVAVFSDFKANAQTFTGIGHRPNATLDSRAFGVSADGTVVVGESRIGATGDNVEAVRWTAAGGLVGMGFLPSGSATRAHAISGDGSIMGATMRVQEAS